MGSMVNQEVFHLHRVISPKDSLNGTCKSAKHELGLLNWSWLTLLKAELLEEKGLELSDCQCFPVISNIFFI